MIVPENDPLVKIGERVFLHRWDIRRTDNERTYAVLVLLDDWKEALDRDTPLQFYAFNAEHNEFFDIHLPMPEPEA